MAGGQFICIGRAPLPGCRASLTVVERRSFETHCEHCEAAFHERWRLWCLGDEDPELEELFGEERRPRKRARA